MALTARQKETLEHLKVQNIESPTAIIKWCEEKLKLPAKTKQRQKEGISGRKQSKKYYQEIINHLQLPQDTATGIPS